MDARPIGVFDSGLGGLTGLAALRALLPGEEFVFFGDTARVPYGGRDRETLVNFARQDVAFLRSFDPKAILVSCGTVSANALTELRGENDLPIYGVIDAAARRAAALTRNGRVGVIATQASVRSGAFQRALAALSPTLEVTARACPRFVPLVESGHFLPGDVLAREAALEYLTPLREAGVDTLILGCTHYPLLAPLIGEIMGPEVELVDVGAVTAAAMADELREQGLLAGEGPGGCRYFVSGAPQTFAALASTFLGESVDRVDQVDIEAY